MAKPKKTKHLSIRVTEAQAARYEEAAGKARREVPDWIRVELDDAADRVIEQEEKK